MALSKTTQDHDEIRTWAEERGGKPAEVASTETKDGPGIIRLEFPGAAHANDSNLKEITWDDFFAKFDESGLALVYQEVTADGEKSNFNRLIHPENASGGSVSAAAGTPAKKPKRGSAQKAPSKAAKKASPTKSAPSAKKTAQKTKSPAKKTAPEAVTKKSAGATAKKVPAKKLAAKKTPAKKAPATKGASKKATAKTAPAKKGVRR